MAKKYFNVDLETSGDLAVGGGVEAGGSISGTDITGTGTVQGSTLTNGTVSITQGSITNVSEITASKVITDEINTSGLLVTGVSPGTAEEVGITVVDTLHSSSHLTLIEGSTGTPYGVKLRYSGGGADANLPADCWSLQSVNDDELENILSCKFSGHQTTLQSASAVHIGIDTNNNSDSDAKFAVYKGVSLSPTDGDPSSGANTEAGEVDATLLLNLGLDGKLTLPEGGIEVSDVFSVDESGNVQADGNLEVVGQVKTNDIRPRSGDTIDLGDKILVDVISPTGSGSSTASTVKITNDADDLDDKVITLQVADSANTGASIEVGEIDSSSLNEAGESGILMGLRIYYKGQSVGGDNRVHISGSFKEEVTLLSSPINVRNTQDVLSFDRDGSDVKLESTNNLDIDSGGYLVLNPTSGLTITGIPQETNNGGGTTHDLTIDAFGTVRYAQSNAFTGTHVYKSTSTIEAGVAVTLSDTQELVICSSSNLTTCVGIVTRSLENFPGDFIEDSFGVKHTEDRDYSILEVAAVGDSRHKGCQGFNVCNENGDIQPGDLLVTSSTPGYLMKQDDDIIRSKTVGKAMEAITFDDNGQATGVYGFIYCG